jgi:hypothetical protein
MGEKVNPKSAKIGVDVKAYGTRVYGQLRRERPGGGSDGLPQLEIVEPGSVIKKSPEVGE